MLLKVRFNGKPHPDPIYPGAFSLRLRCHHSLSNQTDTTFKSQASSDYMYELLRNFFHKYFMQDLVDSVKSTSKKQKSIFSL